MLQGRNVSPYRRVMDGCPDKDVASLETSRCLYNLTLAYEDAEKLYHSALGLIRHRLEPESQKHEQAEESVGNVLQDQLRELGDNLRTLAARHDFATFLAELGDVNAAEQELTRVRSRMRKTKRTEMSMLRIDRIWVTQERQLQRQH